MNRAMVLPVSLSTRRRDSSLELLRLSITADLVAGVQQFQAGVAADVAGPAGDDDVHARSLFCFPFTGCRGAKTFQKISRYPVALLYHKRWPVDSSIPRLNNAGNVRGWRPAHRQGDHL